MKKLFYSLSALIVCFLFVSCGDPIAKMEGIIDDIEENGKDWSAEDWENCFRDMNELALTFWESEPDKKEIKEWDKLEGKLNKAISKATKKEKAEKAFKKAIKNLEKDDDFEDLNEEVQKARKKALKKNKKDDDDDDDDDE